MATVAQFFRHSIKQCHRTVPLKRKWQSPAGSPFHRQFTTSAPRFRDAHGDNNNDHIDDKPAPPPQPQTRKEPSSGGNTRWKTTGFGPEDLNLDPDIKAHYESLSPSEQAEHQQDWAQQDLYMPAMEDDMEADFDEFMRKTEREERAGDEISFPNDRARGRDLGFWADDEEDEDAMVEDGDDEFKDDDITSMAHSELELHREIREYTRRAAWEMPFLTSLAKPFQKPNTKESPLRFRYTTYMGESHPAQSKVVVDFHLSDLDLSEKERLKLIKLLGPRYNPATHTAKMSCEKFDTPAKNKRYLGDVVNSVIVEAKNDQGDRLEDIPVDLRHHKEKKRVTFPVEWELRRGKGQVHVGKVERLLREREERRQVEEERMVVDGEQEVLMQYMYAGQGQGQGEGAGIPGRMPSVAPGR